jgi:hypothetical protein
VSTDRSGVAPPTFWNPPRATPHALEFISDYIDPELRSRLSNLVMDQLAYSHDEGATDLLGVIDAIRSLEQTGKPGQAKDPTKFRHPPLQGLWHAHYFTGRFLPTNLINHTKSVPDSELAATIANSALTLIQKANLIAHRFVVQSFVERANAGKLTGEWIVFAKDAKNVNHYLVIARHSTGDQAIYDLIRTRCDQQFSKHLP